MRHERQITGRCPTLRKTTMESIETKTNKRHNHRMSEAKKGTEGTKRKPSQPSRSNKKAKTLNNTPSPVSNRTRTGSTGLERGAQAFKSTSPQAFVFATPKSVKKTTQQKDLSDEAQKKADKEAEEKAINDRQQGEQEKAQEKKRLRKVKAAANKALNNAREAKRYEDDQEAARERARLDEEASFNREQHHAAVLLLPLFVSLSCFFGGFVSVPLLVLGLNVLPDLLLFFQFLLLFLLHFPYCSLCFF